MTIRPRPMKTIGAALVAVGFLVWLCLQAGCAVGWTEPRPDGTRAAMLGFELGDVAAAGGKIGTFLFDWLGSTEGLIALAGGTGGLGLVGLGLKRLVAAWAGAKAQAASEQASRDEHARTWDEATAAERAAARERDASFDEGISRGAVAPVGPAVRPADRVDQTA